MTEEELQKMDKSFEKTEEEGIKNTLKYFDRIHDKLFAFNNILIAGYFAMSKLNPGISYKFITIPIVNMALLLYIEFRMMQKSRHESRITKLPVEEIHKQGAKILYTNQLSLLAIVTTFCVTMVFLYYLGK